MPATAVEQMILELINRARLDPAAEAARDGIDLNEGLAPGTIPATSVQPLAMNETLLTLARAHNQDEITFNYSAHVDHAGLSPSQRMTAAGYAWTWAGENIAWNGISPGPATQQMQIDNETNLFVDTFDPNRGHRLNLLRANFQEVGVGSTTADSYQGFPSALVTQDFGSTGTGPLLTGVSYNDADHDNFYSIGEGRNGVTVAVSGGGSTTTAGAGGYALAIAAGQQTVTFSGADLASPVSVAVNVLANTNVKVDMVDQHTVTTSASLTDLGGATRIIGLGTIGLTLKGNASAETFSGAKGNDTISGGAGVDSVVFSGARSAYTITNSAGNVIVSGPEGTDTLSSIEKLVFTDQTIYHDAARRDANADGVSDILWRNTATGSTALWDVNAAGGFTAVSVGSVSTVVQIAGVGDFNGDGIADILWRNTATGSTSIWDMDAAGGHTAVGVGTVATFVQVAGVGDFNGDGLADILWRNTTTGSTAIWDMDAAGGHSAVGVGTVATFVQVAGVGDFNGDGLADILWRNTTTGSTAIWDMDAAGGHTAVGVGTVANFVQIAGVGDFNGDGLADILWRNTTTGSTAIWDMDASGGHTAVGVGTVATFVQVAGVGDFNGDGIADILWRNSATGSTSVWDMNAAGGHTAVGIGTASSSWQVSA